MYSRAYQAWFRAGIDAWMLGAEASAVIALRTARMAAGGTAGRREAERMITEKIQAGLELQASLMSEGMKLTPLSGTQRAVRHYRSKVAANKRRLSPSTPS